jgi:hypothetical protein
VYDRITNMSDILDILFKDDQLIFDDSSVISNENHLPLFLDEYEINSEMVKHNKYEIGFKICSENVYRIEHTNCNKCAKYFKNIDTLIKYYKSDPIITYQNNANLVMCLVNCLHKNLPKNSDRDKNFNNCYTTYNRINNKSVDITVKFFRSSKCNTKTQHRVKFISFTATLGINYQNKFCNLPYFWDFDCGFNNELNKLLFGSFQVYPTNYLSYRKEGQDEIDLVQNIIGPNYEITSVHRNQNYITYCSFYNWIDLMYKKNKKNNIKYLFHGTRKTDPKIILKQGFCDRLSSDKCLLGLGSYFTANLDYILNGYAFINPETNSRTFLICVVDLGNTLDGGRCQFKCNDLLSLGYDLDTGKKYDSVSSIVNYYADERTALIYNTKKCTVYPLYLVEISNKFLNREPIVIMSPSRMSEQICVKIDDQTLNNYYYKTTGSDRTTHINAITDYIIKREKMANNLDINYDEIIDATKKIEEKIFLMSKGKNKSYMSTCIYYPRLLMNKQDLTIRPDYPITAHVIDYNIDNNSDKLICNKKYVEHKICDKTYQIEITDTNADADTDTDANGNQPNSYVTKTFIYGISLDIMRPRWENIDIDYLSIYEVDKTSDLYIKIFSHIKKSSCICIDSLWKYENNKKWYKLVLKMCELMLTLDNYDCPIKFLYKNTDYKCDKLCGRLFNDTPLRTTNINQYTDICLVITGRDYQIKPEDPYPIIPPQESDDTTYHSVSKKLLDNSTEYYVQGHNRYIRLFRATYEFNYDFQQF